MVRWPWIPRRNSIRPITIYMASLHHTSEGSAKVAAPSGGNTEAIADVLFSEYLLPFEVASVLLLVAVVGSVFMARRKA